MVTTGQEQDAHPDAECGKNELGGCFHEEWRGWFKRACAATVAQVSNLLDRRLPVGRASEEPVRPDIHGACGFGICDPAD